MKTLNDISIVDIMDSDYNVHLTAEREGYNLALNPYGAHEEVCIKHINPELMENLAEFCRVFLLSYNKLNRSLADLYFR